MTTKICKKCGIEKDINDFHKYISSKDGYKTICKQCISSINKMPDVRKKNYENSKNWRKINRENLKKYKYI